MKTNTLKLFWQTIALVFTLLPMISGVARRCWECRSRGEYGDCRDPFHANRNNLDMFPQVDPSPCASGWCAKIIEGNELQYTVATERLCLQTPPDDGEERCAETEKGHQKIFMCFCMGDLCNGSPKIIHSNVGIVVVIAGLIVNWILR